MQVEDLEIHFLKTVPDTSSCIPRSTGPLLNTLDLNPLCENPIQVSMTQGILFLGNRAPQCKHNTLFSTQSKN